MALVVAYHLSPSAVPGGFLGVDVFFVLSGFLITSLAVTEVRQREGFRLRAFYVRRIRRLLPALLLLLSGGRRCTRGCGPDPVELDRLRDHSLWTLGYLANWRFIADGDDLHGRAATAQSPLRHTWSLAIEEQFYILFPLLVLGIGAPGALAGRGRCAGRSVGWRSLARSASATWMAVLWGDGTDPVARLLRHRHPGALAADRRAARGGAGGTAGANRTGGSGRRRRRGASPARVGAGGRDGPQPRGLRERCSAAGSCSSPSGRPRSSPGSSGSGRCDGPSPVARSWASASSRTACTCGTGR